MGVLNGMGKSLKCPRTLSIQLTVTLEVVFASTQVLFQSELLQSQRRVLFHCISIFFLFSDLDIYIDSFK